MFEVGDEVLIKAKVLKAWSKPFEYICEVGNGSCKRTMTFPDNCIMPERTYEQGLSDAWKLAKKIGQMDCIYLDVIFGSDEESVWNHTYEEALAKIEAYEKEKEIKVGDEVVHGEGSFQTKFTVTFFESNRVEGFDKNGNTHSFCYPNPYIKKTGKHIDIESLLRQIGE